MQRLGLAARTVAYMTDAGKQREDFPHQHNAGNDSAASSKGVLGLAFDNSVYHSRFRAYANTHDPDEIRRVDPDTTRDMNAEILHGMNRNVIVVAFDTEGADDSPDVTEVGFCVFRLQDVGSTPPGVRGEHWHQ